MAVSFGAQGAVSNSTTNGTSVSPSYPSGVVLGDMLVLVIGMKPAAAGGGTVTTPVGWTLAGSLLDKGGYGSTIGDRVGNVNLFFYTRIASGGESGALAVTLAGSNASWAHISRWSATSSWSPVVLSGTEQAVATSMGFTAATATSVDVRNGDVVLAAMAITSGHGGGLYATHSLTAYGSTFGSATELAEAVSSAGNSVGGVLLRASSTAGSSVAPVTWTTTFSEAELAARGPIGVLILRETGLSIVGTDGAVFVYDYVDPVPAGGAVYVYENTVSGPNPANWQFWDGTQWTRAYSYVWNGTEWQQVGIP